MTSPDEIQNAMIYAVIFVGILVIGALVSMVSTRYKIYKINKYVKEAKEREEAEKTSIKTTRGKW
jgi:hypothetical protein